MKRLAGLILTMLALAGCSTAPKLACPAGQAQLRTAQLFLEAKPPAQVREADLRKFVDTEVDGGGQWKGDENRRIREAAKVVLIVLPENGDPRRSVEAVRAAYRTKFKQDSVVVLPPPACVAL